MSRFQKVLSVILALFMTLLSSPLYQSNTAMAAQRVPWEASTTTTVELTVTRTSTTHLAATAKSVETGYAVTVDYEYSVETQGATAKFIEWPPSSQILTTVEYKPMVGMEGQRWTEIQINGKTIARMASDTTMLKLPDSLPLDQPITQIIKFNLKDLAGRIGAETIPVFADCTGDYLYDNILYMRGYCWGEQIGDGVAYTHPGYLYYQIPSWSDVTLNGNVFHHIQKGTRTVERWDATSQSLVGMFADVFAALAALIPYPILAVIISVIVAVVGGILGLLVQFFWIALKDERGAVWFRYDIHPQCRWVGFIPFLCFRDIAVGPYDLGEICIPFACW